MHGVKAALEKVLQRFLAPASTQITETMMGLDYASKGAYPKDIKPLRLRIITLARQLSDEIGEIADQSVTGGVDIPATVRMGHLPAECLRDLKTITPAVIYYADQVLTLFKVCHHFDVAVASAQGCVSSRATPFYLCLHELSGEEEEARR